MKKGDKIVGIILLIIVVITLSATFVYKNSIKGAENIAVIKRSGKILKTIDLNKVLKPEEFTLKTENGDFNTIAVKHNSIRIINANCANKLCVKSGWISRPGEIIVCLPFKLIININSKSNNEVDGVTH